MTQPGFQFHVMYFCSVSFVVGILQSSYGEVVDCVVVMNPSTGKSRGFGFVTFKDPACVETVQAAGPHLLDGKQIDPNGCNRKKTAKVFFLLLSAYCIEQLIVFC